MFAIRLNLCLKSPICKDYFSVKISPLSSRLTEFHCILTVYSLVDILYVFCCLAAQTTAAKCIFVDIQHNRIYVKPCFRDFVTETWSHLSNKTPFVCSTNVFLLVCWIMINSFGGSLGNENNKDTLKTSKSRWIAKTKFCEIFFYAWNFVGFFFKI